MDRMEKIDPEAISHLERIVGTEAVSAGDSARDLHSHDESFHTPVRPDIVVWPRSTEAVSGVVRWAYDKGVPVTPWGAGTSMEGNPIPVRGGVVVSLQEMTRVLEIREQDFQVDVEAGVIYKALNEKLGRLGLLFPPDPGASATIGGMIGNNASGIRTVGYGATRDYVTRLTVVLPGGEVIRTGNRARKSSSGYDLCGLFTGAEGTLGIVTEATLELEGLPACVTAARAAFPTVDDATATVYQIMSSGLVPSAMELLDTEVVKVLNRDRGTALDESPTLLMEFFGYSEKGLAEEIAFVEAICNENHCSVIDKGIGREERNRLWEIRHLTAESIKRANPGRELLVMDVAVPISRFGEMIRTIKVEVADLTAYVFGHAGDGNIHVVVMDDPSDEVRWSRVERANDRIVREALAAGGTCTGEHGVGVGKRRFLEEEHGESRAVMRAIKDALDPRGLMNPGKIFLDDFPED